MLNKEEAIQEYLENQVLNEENNVIYDYWNNLVLQLKNLILLQDVDSKIIKIYSTTGDLPERIGLKRN